MIDYFHKNFHPWDKPRTYRRVARKEYLALAKSKKRTQKKIRATIRKQLGYVRKDLEYLDKYMEMGYALPREYINYYLTIQKLYEQQKYMYVNKTHSVENRIVSISQPYLRPIVRGKAVISVRRITSKCPGQNLGDHQGIIKAAKRNIRIILTG